MVDGGMPFPMLSDENGNISRMYDVYDAVKGAPLRGTLIIDPTGLIHSMELLSNPIGRSMVEILRQLRAFQHYVATGELIPCDWQPGEKTLQEAVEKVAHIWEEWKPKQNK
jgi:peroxiredoxin (alkyl hydroperoxide reductase subunit C)